MTPLIELENISLDRAGRPILRNISLTVNPGEHWAMLGPNGSGKTTLLTVITAYAWPMEGAVTVLGNRYGSIDIREVRRRIGLVSSALFERVPPRDTFFDVVLSGRYASLGIWEEIPDADRERAREIIAFLDCASIADRPYGVLSFGERQRALIGRALMPEPRILILDEPCEGLDMHARETLLHRLDALISAPDGPSLMMVTHRVEEIPPGVTHALVLKEGRVLATGEKHATITSAKLSES
ncbi:MAG: ABC transporter ATP-binding protein, partial [Candidatus Latescibacterota bacterium]